MNQNIVSVIDLMPTIPDVAGVNLPTQQKYFGKALLKQSNKKPTNTKQYASGSFDESAHGYPVPMRGVISAEWNYVFNTWSDGKHEIKSAAMNHLTFGKC